MIIKIIIKELKKKINIFLQCCIIIIIKTPIYNYTVFIIIMIIKLNIYYNYYIYTKSESIFVTLYTLQLAAVK